MQPRSEPRQPGSATEAADGGMEAAAFGIEVAAAVGRPALRRAGACVARACRGAGCGGGRQPGWFPARIQCAGDVLNCLPQRVGDAGGRAVVLVRLAGTLGRVSSGRGGIRVGEGNRAAAAGDEQARRQQAGAGRYTNT